MGAALIAADGVRSLFRADLVDDGEPHPIGYAAHRTIVPMAELKNYTAFKDRMVKRPAVGRVVEDEKIKV